MNDFAPKVLVFCCSWCSHVGADLTGTAELNSEPYLRVIRTMCSGRMEPAFILRAFAQGTDGVMITGCQPGDCHYNNGNYKTKRRMMLLKNMLPQLGIEPERLRLEWISTADLPKFHSAVNEFIDEVKELGPLTLNNEEGRLN